MSAGNRAGERHNALPGFLVIRRHDATVKKALDDAAGKVVQRAHYKQEGEANSPAPVRIAVTLTPTFAEILALLVSCVRRSGNGTDFYVTPEQWAAEELEQALIARFEASSGITAGEFRRRRAEGVRFECRKLRDGSIEIAPVVPVGGVTQ